MTQQLTRKQKIEVLFPDQPSYRKKQIDQALFDTLVHGWSDVSTLPKNMREVLETEVDFMTVKEVQVYESKKQDTFKAVLVGNAGEEKFESVIMANAKGQWTMCVSSQVGCAMGCTFCATGAMGFVRNLSSDEIVDQYRFWKTFLSKKPDLAQRISNIVFMGMGEPMANYENVKSAIHTWLDYTDIGPTKITVSTVGVLGQMQKLLTDPEWPPVRIAISLHSPDEYERKKIVPSSASDFLNKLATWSHEYMRKLGNRQHYLTFEYTLINEVNDSLEDAELLRDYVLRTAIKKVNVIPLNEVKGKKYTKSKKERIEAFKKVLLSAGIDITQRRTMGDDIAAACGQLATME